MCRATHAAGHGGDCVWMVFGAGLLCSNEDGAACAAGLLVNQMVGAAAQPEVPRGGALVLAAMCG